MVEDIEDLYELSPVQQGMLFQSLYAPQSGVYCVQLSCLLRGDLDIRAFVRSWQQVLARHTILRTAFFWEEISKPLQVVHRRVALPLEEQDWRGLSTIEQATRFEALLESDRTRGFELSMAPLMRLALIRTAEDSHRLLWSFHHLLLDGWSVFLLFKELFAVYDASTRGRRLQFGPVRPFRDYIAWLQQQDLSRAEDFWRASLKGFSVPTSLSLEMNSTAMGAGSSHGEHRFDFSENTTNALRLLARRHQLTLNTLIQGAWALLLSRHSGEHDVVFGVTAAGRPTDLREADTMIGLFINTLPARVQIAGAEPAMSWLRRLQEQQAEQRHYEFTPLTQVQRWREGARGEALFESILVFENYPVDDAVRERSSEQDLQIADMRFHEQTEYPLTVVVAPGKKLTLRLGYDSSRFSRSAIERMAGHLQELLNSILDNPQQLIAGLRLLTADEERQMLYEWNETGRAYGSESLTQLFEAQVERTPEAVAVVFGGEEVSYRELNERANQLAHHLQSLGVGAETLVGILMERSLEMVVSLLAVLKAGGAYVPLDPEYPSARVSFMLADAGVSVVLTQARLLGEVKGGEARVVSVDSEWAVIGGESRENPASTTSGENLAYVIYTSGSTGQPKGAMNTHGGIVNRLLWMQEAYALQDDDVVMQKTPFSFDVSVWEFFWPLLAGARLVVARPGAQRDPAYLRDLIIAQHITTMHFVPSMLAAFVDEQRIEDCRSLRRVICSGEALPLSLQERFFAHFDLVELHNLYGPTEAAIDVTFWACERESGRRNVPIGRPISNTEIYLLDEDMRLVPVGVRGELYIGGMGVGRGYLNRAGLTAERFVPHPFTDVRGARLYRTGDVCCWQEDGQIEYVGRKDYQVKVRGHRIELGEIEAALRRCGGVRDCVVVAESDREKRLLAYIVGDVEQVSVGEWRAQLQKELPEYMIPVVFVKLEELPLTPSGKVDRRALPAVETGRPMLGSTYAAPCTPLEELLVVIWSEVLDVSPVGVLDNFFELGGDSIRSIQILAKAQKAGITFSLQHLFKHPTIRDLARVARIDQANESEVFENKEFSLISESDRQRLPDDVEDAYPLTQLQAGMIFHSEYSPATAIYHDIFGFHIRARFDSEVLQTVLRELLKRHPVLRTSFDLTQFSEPLQLVHRAVAVPLQVDDLIGASPERQSELLAAWKETEKSRNFDWAQAPLIRVHVHLRSEDSFQFTLSFHHTILDGWSVASLLAEVFLHYASLMSGEPTPAQLTPPVARFGDLVALERSALESEECQRYWGEKLSDSQFIKIPRWRSLSRPFDAAQTRTHPVQIRSEVSRKLIEVAREASVPLKSVLLAAHLRVMKLLSGQSDVLTGLVSNGRPEVTDGERVFGLFLNALGFRLQMEGGTWAELLQATFEAERELLPFRRYPMAQMQKEQGGQALFEAGFNFNHFHLFKSLPKFPEMEVVDGDIFEATNYVLTANFGLDVFSSEIQLALFYNASELADEQVIAYGNYYVTALEAIANNASARYDQTNLLAGDEERQMLYEWNETGGAYGSESLTQLFEAQVERTPEAVAVVFGGEEVSYRELNERANQLAHYLQSLGVGAETLVGIMMERSLEMVVSLLAVLKAGGAYVPLDPEYPSARVSFMLADAGVSVLLTQARLLGEVEGGEARVVSVDSEWAVIGGESRENPASTTSGENLAYVIYTSGSTGTPNGVLVQHNSVANLIQQARSIFQVDSDSRVLHVASFSFDASVLELFLALSSGASLYLCSRAQRLSPDEVSALVRSRQLTTAVLTPSLLKVLDHEQCRSLRTISSGGERLTADVAERWSVADRRMLNCYGPTEATIFATYAKCVPGDDSAASTARAREPAIGRGLENVPVYVLDAAMALVPVGVIGELYIGGAGVARGYLGRADLTAERFVPDPYSVVPGARMYRTGDDAKWRREGELEYVGRRDEQVKIRGQRLELAEVEAILRKQEGVRECAVALRDGTSGEQRLIAYVVADKPLSLNPGNETTGKSGVLSERPELCPSVAEYFVYDDYLYDTLSHDERRNNKYRAVINRNVRNKVVLDIGTGPDAILARLCVEGGAKRVYAIEVLEQTYRQAVAAIKSLGLDDRIILIHGDSMQVQLPEKVDVCVSEIVGSIGGSEGAAPIINNAHRWLKPDGVMIPERSRTFVAAASLPDELLDNPGFSEMGANYVARIFEQVGHPFDLRLCIRNFPESHLISKTEIFEDLNFIEQAATEYRREVHLRITRKGKLDGLLVWLNLHLGEGEVIDVLEPGYSWFPIYFPVFYPGVEVDEGDAIVAACSGRPSGNGINPDYRMEGKLVRSDGSEIEFDYQSGHHETRYRHGAFYRLIFGEDGAVRKREQTEVTSQRLRTQLKRHLPDYMIPQSFLILDQLPLTPTGKIDRKSLPAPETIRSEMERPHIAPRTLLEQRLVDIWSHLLGIQQISIHDSFFDLGGHSLLSTRLISQLRQTFAIEISLRRFFEIPTVALLAVEIEKLNNGGAGIKETVIKSLPRESRRMKRSALVEGNP